MLNPIRSGDTKSPPRGFHLSEKQWHKKAESSLTTYID